MKYNPEYISSFLSKTEGTVEFRKQKLAFIAALFVFCVPTALLGKAFDFVDNTIIVSMMILMIWSIVVNSSSRSEVFLYKGSFVVFSSLVLFYAAYKIQYGRSNVDEVWIVAIPCLYIILACYSVLNELRRIKKGYYLNKVKGVNLAPYAMTFGGIGMTIGRLFKGKLTNDDVLFVFMISAITLGLLLSLGVTNFLKYNFVKNGTDKDSSELP